MIGEIIKDRYRLDSVLGHGGMGAVYKGHDIMLERDVALKLLNQVVFKKDEQDRLLHEARLIARLRHPNIVSVYDAGDFNNTPYFVMEYVDGGSLRDKQTNSLGDISGLLIQICRGLGAAHEQGIIHRDLKPENILLDKDGSVKLVDFGIARSDISQFTSEGQIAGTASYLAPEIIKGDSVDNRADLYSLGVIMYELTSEQLPFTADSLLGVINKQLFEDVIPPVDINPEIPGELNELILRLLSKDPHQRPASAGEVQDALESISGDKDQPAIEFIDRVRTPAMKSKHNLRAQSSSFIGREADLEQISSILSDAECRLLTLVGIGGIGKTRLATQAAYDAVGNYPDGVWMIELAALTEAELLPQQVAAIFGVSAQEARQGQGETEVLVEYLAEKELLLVVDNCEHLIEPCAELVDTLLRGCPKMKVLATSREDLHIGGETIYQVNPLDLPEGDISVEEFQNYAAIELFIERAVAAQRSFSLSPENSAAVNQICEQLDGIPLAIELAAARIKMLSPEQIADRLGDRFQLLKAGSRTALPRHQTLAAAMDWSYDLLSDGEKELLRKLAIFTGGFTLAAVEKVFDHGREGRIEVFDLTAQLVDKSLVQVDEQSDAARYKLLETVRQYGISKLRAEGELEQARRDHSAYFVQLVEEMDKGLRSEQQVENLAVLDAEHDNLRGALRWSFNSQDADLAFRFVSALGWFWFMRGYWKESWNWLTQSLDLEADFSPMLRAKAIIRAGGLELIRGKLEGATDLVEQSLITARAANDLESTAWCLNLLGQAGTWGYKEIDVAETRLSESLEIFRATGNDWGSAWTLRYLGQVAQVKGDYETSISRQRDGLKLLDDIRDTWNYAHSLYSLGCTLYLYGDYEAAKAAFEQALLKCNIVEDKVMAAHAVRGLATLALQRNDLNQAEQLSLEALEALQKIGDMNCVSVAMRDLGEISRRQGQYEQAMHHLDQSLKNYLEMGNDVPIGITIERFASLAGSMGDYRKAVYLLAAVEKNIGDTISSSPTLDAEHKELVSVAKDHFGPETFEQYWNEGIQMDLRQAAAFAMEE